MQLKGKVIKVLPVVTGTGKNGTWHKQEFVIEHGDAEHKRSACFTLMNDKTSQAPFDRTNVTVNFEIESREYNGRYFTNLLAWKVE